MALFAGTRARLILWFAIVVLAGVGLDAQAGGPVRGGRSDPPGFGLVTVKSGQTISLHMTCFAHQVGLVPPGPCVGTAMFHDAAGQVLTQARFNLMPGESRSLDFTVPQVVGDAIVPPVLADPCWLPASGGRVIPSVEVFDAAGRLLLFEHPAAPRMTEFNNAFVNPGVIAGFNPQPDPPAFGLVTLARGDVARLNVSCFSHPINLSPPDPCHGTVMFHDAAGNVLAQGDYDLQPGQATSFEFLNQRRGVSVELDPCILPAPGGRAVPNVEVVDGVTGDTLFLINPAAARASEFQ